MVRLAVIAGVLLLLVLRAVIAGDEPKAQTRAPLITSVTVRRNLAYEQTRAFLERRSPNQRVAAKRAKIAADGTLQAIGLSLDELIREAYGYVRRHPDDVVSAKWLRTEHYDLTVTADRSDWGPVRPWDDLPLQAEHSATHCAQRAVSGARAYRIT